MSKPKIIWAPAVGQSCTIRYCHYGGIKIALYHEHQAATHGNDKFRIRCLLPRKARLGSPVVFTSEPAALNRAELEAERLHQNMPAIDFMQIESWRSKAEQYDQVVSLCDKINHAPEEAVYELTQLYEMTGDRKPADAIGRWLDEFVRVKCHMTVDALLAKAVKRIQEDKKLIPETKRDCINVSNQFADYIGRHRLIEEVTVDEGEGWYWDLDCGVKRAYDCWLVVRNLFRLAYQRYGAITKWVYDQLMELNYSARANTVTVLMPQALLRAMFARCAYLNDAIYLGILAFIPLRRAELQRLGWEYIEYWSEGRPRIFHLPAVMAKGERGFQGERFIDIPPNLANLLLACRQERGPIIIGEGHQERLATLAKAVDPNFDWPHNVLRRSCISNGVADTNDKAYWQAQAGHDAEAQARYLRPVDPLLAREYRTYTPDLERLKGLPRAAADFPSKQGRPHRDLAKPIEPKEGDSPTAQTGTEIPDRLLPKPARRADGSIDWEHLSENFLESVLTKYELPDIAAGWDTTLTALQRQVSKRKLEPSRFRPLVTGDHPNKIGQIETATRPSPAAPMNIPSAPSETEPRATVSLAPGENRAGEPEIAAGPAATPPVARPAKRRTRKCQYAWPSRFRFLVLLWTIPATHIARMLGCSQASVISRAHVVSKLPTPGHGYWQKMKSGMSPSVPAQVRELYLTLRAEAAPGEVTDEIPEPFRTPASPSLGEATEPEPPGERPASLTTPRKGKLPPVTGRRSHVVLPLSKGDFLEQLWSKSASQIGRELGCSYRQLLKAARASEIQPPPPNYWQRRKQGDPVVIPPEIAALIQQLRSGPDGLRQVEPSRTVEPPCDATQLPGVEFELHLL